MPVLVFNQNISIIYIDDDAIQESKGLPPFNDKHALDSGRTQVWKLVGDEASKVGLNNELVHRRDLRDSFTIKDKFRIKDIPHVFKHYFSEIKIGVGSKHTYYENGFMKEHLDSRLPDLDGLPHIMTLIVTDNLSKLKINGNFIKCPSTNLDYTVDGKFCIFFTLDCPHEVIPLEFAEVRHSFTFPVYGKYTPMHTILPNPTLKVSESSEPTESKEPTELNNIYDVVLEQLDDFCNDIENDYAKLQGYIDSLNDSTASSLIVRLREHNGDYVPRERGGQRDHSRFIDYDLEDDIEPKTKVTYTDSAGIKQEELISYSLSIPSATDVVISVLSFEDRILEKLKEIVQGLEKEYVESYKALIDEKVSPIDEKLVSQVPIQPFIMVLNGKYFFDATEENLIPCDKELCRFLRETCKRTVIFKPSMNLTHLERLYSTFIICYTDIDNNQLSIQISQKNNNRIETRFDVSADVAVEFDDQGGYDPIYTRQYGVLIVI
jgi:hypothetical protein